MAANLNRLLPAPARNLWTTLSGVLRHPLNSDARLRALGRYLAWQVGSRLVPGSVAVPFVDGTRLLAKPGMVAATANIYLGLHEFEDMAFVLHLLRPDDLFADVGANIGSYTVLASGAVGCRSVAFEPVPKTFEHLLDNLHLNRIMERVRPVNAAVGAAQGSVFFSVAWDCKNHVVAEGANEGGASVRVPVVALDDEFAQETPTVMKIDVEGYEKEVVQGSKKTLAKPGLLAVIMELNGSGQRYGYSDEELHARMLAAGFRSCRYCPLQRDLRDLEGSVPSDGNAVYVRDMEAVKDRLRGSRQYQVHGRLL